MSDNNGFPPPSQQNNQPQGQQSFGSPVPPASAKKSGLAVAALVLGIVTAVISFIPVVNQLAYLTGLVGIVLAIIALVKKAAGRGSAIAGLVLSVIGIIIATIVIIVTIAFLSTVKDSLGQAGSDFSSAAAQFSSEAAQPHTVKYVVTSDVPAKADFTTADGSSNEPVTGGSWEKEVTMTGSFVLANVSVSADSFTAPSNLSCEIFIDGKSFSKKTGAGLVTCTGTLN